MFRNALPREKSAFLTFPGAIFFHTICQLKKDRQKKIDLKQLPSKLRLTILSNGGYQSCEVQKGRNVNYEVLKVKAYSEEGPFGITWVYTVVLHVSI